MNRPSPAGRHRAPSRIATALAQGRYSATSTFSVAASGGILASSVLVATTHSQADLEAAMTALEPVVGPDAVAADQPAADAGQRAEALQAATATLTQVASTVALPVAAEIVIDPVDLPARAVAAPADAENAAVGELGFVGVTPVVEEPEPVVEPQTESVATETVVTETEVAAPAEARSETTASRSESREAAPATTTSSTASASTPVSEPEPEPAPAPEPEPAPVTGSGGGEAAIGWAYNHLGLPYSYGSDSGGGYDCSGFVRAAYRSAGITLPHGSSAQYSATSRVSLDNIRRGDLLFYSNGGGIYHVAIYLGDGQVIHSLRDGSGFSGSKVTGMNYSPGLFAAGRP